MYENKKIFILGMARSGYEVAKLLSQYTKNITIVDENDSDPHIDELKALGINVIIADRSIQDQYLDDSFDLVIKNPGAPIDVPVMLKAQELGLPITNEIEIAYTFWPKDITIVGITGSNGKTTVTTLIHNILTLSDRNAHIGGNIGYPASTLVGKVKSNDILVLEISDRQLTNIDTFKNHIGILTNLTPTHLDFWGEYDIYKSMKKRIFINQTANDIAIINLDNEDSLTLTEDIPSTKKFFSTKQKTDAYLEGNTIYYQDTPMVNIDELKLSGLHNYENMMTAIIACKQLNIPDEFIKEGLKNFGGVPHRIEFVKEINNIKIYNDSKSTNTTSTITALKTFNQPTVLILGGLNSNQDFSELKDYMKHVKTVVCYGENKLFVKEAMDKLKVKVMVTDSIEEAVMASELLLEAGDVLLFSPASASWDQFKDFEERGNKFKELVAEW